MKLKKIVPIKLICFSLILSVIFFHPGCSSDNTFDENSKEPQVIINPDQICLSVATLAKTEYLFEGKGFTPGESVLIEMIDVPVDDLKIELAVANADIKEDGTFKAEIGIITKISEFMRAKIDAMNNTIIITKPPMPEGEYRVRASSLMSEEKAFCTLTVAGPGIIGSIKDFLGKMLGKIIEKDSEEVK